MASPTIIEPSVPRTTPCHPDCRAAQCVAARKAAETSLLRRSFAEIRKQVFATKVVFDQEIVEMANADQDD
jgi:hypothetical protein